MQITHVANGCFQTIRDRLNQDTLDDWCEAVSGSCSVAARCFYSVARRVTLFSRVFSRVHSMADWGPPRAVTTTQQREYSYPLRAIVYRNTRCGHVLHRFAMVFAVVNAMATQKGPSAHVWIILASWLRHVHTPSEQLDLAYGSLPPVFTA